MEMRLPAIGFSMSEATLTEWLVADGDTVSEGQAIYVIELDKSSQEIESPKQGVIRINAEAGAVYQIGALLATIE